MSENYAIHTNSYSSHESTNENYVIHTNSYSSNEKIRASVVSEASASEDTKGIVRLATEEEALEGTNRSAVITPYTLSLVKTQTYTYVHEQAVASDNWVIEHNLNKPCPNVVLVDSAGTVFYPATKYIDNNKCIVPLIGAMTGTAYVS